MGLFDHYRQFEALSAEEVSAQLRGEAAERRGAELAVLAPLDLSRTTWPELPHPNVAAAISHAARSGLRSYPDPRAADLRRQIARRHRIDPSRIAIGNGAAALICAAARQLLGPGQTLLTPWPSYPLYPLLASRLGADARAIRPPGSAAPGDDGSATITALLEAIDDRSRLLMLANPNDPTGALLEPEALRSLLRQLPEHVVVALDEALIDFIPKPATASGAGLLEEFPRLLVFRSFSKAWGLAGLRAGYALGGPGSEQLLAQIEPDLGIAEPVQAGILEALRSCEQQIAQRALEVGRERSWLEGALREHGMGVSCGHANFLWCSHRSLTGTELAERLQQAGIRVAAGADFGDDRHVRISIRSRAAATRLLATIDEAG